MPKRLRVEAAYRSKTLAYCGSNPRFETSGPANSSTKMAYWKSRFQPAAFLRSVFWATKAINETNRELGNIYHHYPESMKRKSSERIAGAIDPFGRYGIRRKTSKTISTTAIIGPVEAISEKRAATVEVDTFQGEILAVWIFAAKLPDSDLNFAVDFWVDFSSCFLKEKGPEKSTNKKISRTKFTRKSVRINSPRISAEAFSWIRKIQRRRDDNKN